MVRAAGRRSANVIDKRKRKGQPMPKDTKPSPGHLSQHFQMVEFACRCGKCGSDGSEVSPMLIGLLEIIRSWWGKPLHILSGFRCASHNKAVGGAKASYHLKGMAADFVVRDVSVQEVADTMLAKMPGVFGIGVYPSFIHFDVRETAWRKPQRE